MARERLLTEAMRLFSDKGFEATSVSQIEAAAGLAAGAGALYRHFKSKDALLDAGIDRQLDRRAAMHDIRALLAGLGDLHTELTVLGRYLLTVIDQETRTPADRRRHARRTIGSPGHRLRRAGRRTHRRAGRLDRYLGTATRKREDYRCRTRRQRSTRDTLRHQPLSSYRGCDSRRPVPRRMDHATRRPYRARIELVAAVTPSASV